MNIIDAWKAAKTGQKIQRGAGAVYLSKNLAGFNFVKFNSFWVFISQFDDNSIIADDWEVVKEKKKVEYELIDFWRGGVPLKENTVIQYHGNTIPNNAKITIEWEE